MPNNVVVAGLRVGTGVFVPGHGVILNYPGRFSDAQVAELISEGYTFVRSSVTAPAVSVHSYETHLPPVAPLHLTDAWEAERESADILASSLPVDTVVGEVVEEIVVPVIARKTGTTPPVRPATIPK